MTKEEVAYYEKKGFEYVQNDLGYNYHIERRKKDSYEDPIDYGMTSKTQSHYTYYVEGKNYTIGKHTRTSTKFDDYQIDFNKIKTLYEESERDGRRAILYVVFTDETYIWHITEELYNRFTQTKRWVFCTETSGEDYGKKRVWKLQGYLKLSDAKAHYKTKYFN